MLALHPAAYTYKIKYASLWVTVCVCVWETETDISIIQLWTLSPDKYVVLSTIQKQCTTVWEWPKHTAETVFISTSSIHHGRWTMVYTVIINLQYKVSQKICKHVFVKPFRFCLNSKYYRKVHLCSTNKMKKFNKILASLVAFSVLVTKNTSCVWLWVKLWSD